jgi:hypothetical protein
MDIEGVSVFIFMTFQEHGYIIHEKIIVFISVRFMNISMDIFISTPNRKLVW